MSRNFWPSSPKPLKIALGSFRILSKYSRRYSQGAASAVYTNEDKSLPSFILRTVFNEEQGKKCIVLQVEAVTCTSTDIHVLHYSGFWLGYAHLRCAHPSFKVSPNRDFQLPIQIYIDKLHKMSTCVTQYSRMCTLVTSSALDTDRVKPIFLYWARQCSLFCRFRFFYGERGTQF